MFRGRIGVLLTVRIRASLSASLIQVGDIRRFIASFRPGGLATYSLQTNDRPPQVLADDSANIVAAKLVNTLLVQVP